MTSSSSIHVTSVLVSFREATRSTWAYALFLWLLFGSVGHVHGAGSGSSNRSSGDTSSYVSVRALDEFGDAVQVSHAVEAARRHGRLVVAAVVQNPSSVDDGMSAVDTTRAMEEAENGASASPPPFIVVVSVGTTPVVHSIRLPLAADDGASLPSSMMAMCCSGIKGDANWLIGKVQRHVSEIWESYDQSNDLSAGAVSHLVARLLGRFSNHQEKNEWQSNLGLPGKNENKDQRKQLSAWARPMGVQTMILSCSSKAKVAELSSPDGLLLIDPSGRILTPEIQSPSGSILMAAMGKDSDKVQARLVRLVPNPQERGSFHSSLSSPLAASSWGDAPPTLEICRDTLIRIVLEEVAQSSSGRGRDTGGELMVEVFASDRGMRIQRQVYRYENSNTFFPITGNNIQSTRDRR